VTELLEFGKLVLVVAAGFSLALASTALSARFPLPRPAIFLFAAALASDLFPSLAEHVSIREVERIGVVALIVILFDGGLHVGWRRFRASAAEIVSLGLVGTFATAGLMALAVHWLFGFSWIAAGILGAALAPTDPAVTFSVLGNREVGGRSGTILEGESGVNDPVGIALMVGMLELARHHDASFAIVVREFSIELAVGLAIGLAGAFLLLPLLRRPLPNEGLYPLRTLAAAGTIYGTAAVAHGSGFLAVFVAGLIVGDARAPYKAEIERFHNSLANLAEIVVFVALGLTIDLTDLGANHLWLDGLLLALILALLARPLITGALLLPLSLRPGERLFVMWGGLKGAVPILLAALALLAGVDDARRLYAIVFVVVAFSVLVQGTSIPLVAAKTGVPLRLVEPEPWSISIGLRHEPRGVLRFIVAPGSRAEGTTIRELPLGERAWVSLVIRDGEARQARGSHTFAPGDEVLVLTDTPHAPALRRLFERPDAARDAQQTEPQRRSASLE
jgi:cell volume regulation protein A